MISLSQCLRSIANPRLYSRQQSFALAFAVICTVVDIWAVVSTVESLPAFGGIKLPGRPVFGPVFWIMEILMAAAIVLLLAFAFSTRPVD